METEEAMVRGSDRIWMLQLSRFFRLSNIYHVREVNLDSGIF